MFVMLNKVVGIYHTFNLTQEPNINILFIFFGLVQRADNKNYVKKVQEIETKEKLHLKNHSARVKTLINYEV